MTVLFFSLSQCEYYTIPGTRKLCTPALKYFYTPVLEYFYTPALKYFYTPVLEYFYTPALKYFYTPVLEYAKIPDSKGREWHDIAIIPFVDQSALIDACQIALQNSILTPAGMVFL